MNHSRQLSNLHLSISRGKLKEERCDQGALIPARDRIRHFTRARLRATAVIAVFTRIVLQRVEHDDSLYNGDSCNFADRQSGGCVI
jgi:hypothetical protein